MNKNFKQIVSMILSVCMIITMLPVTVYAEAGESKESVTRTIKQQKSDASTTQAAIKVSEQQGFLFEGKENINTLEGGIYIANAFFLLETENILPDNYYPVEVIDLPDGVTIKGDGTIKIDANGEAKLDLVGSEDTIAGITEGVSLRIEVEDNKWVESNEFKIMIMDINFMNFYLDDSLKAIDLIYQYLAINALSSKKSAYKEGKNKIDFDERLDELKLFDESEFDDVDLLYEYFDDSSKIYEIMDSFDALIETQKSKLENFINTSVKEFFKDEAFNFFKFYQLSFFQLQRTALELYRGDNIDKEDYENINKEAVELFTNTDLFIEFEKAENTGDWGKISDLASNLYEDLCDILEKYGIGEYLEKEYYHLTVGNVLVTSANKDNITGEGISGNGTVSYNPNTKTLTLDNAKIAVEDEDYSFKTAIKVSGKIDDLSIELKGDSQIGKMLGKQEDSGYTILIAIENDKKITVKGSGNLTIYDQEMGIVAKDITIAATGTIQITERGVGLACCLKADGGTLEIKSGTLILSSIISNGLYGDKIIISGGNITIESLNLNDNNNYAFNRAPEFASGYRYKVYTGESKDSFTEISNPNADTFTKSKYVKIIPFIYTDDDGDHSYEPATPIVPTVPAVPPTTTEPVQKPVEEILNDVGTHWALSSIQFVYDRGIMTGTSAEQFSPEARMDRAMLITALGRLAGVNTLNFISGSFNDVDMSAYYGPYAEWSLKSNITKGTGNNNFSPNKPITREELAVILVNFAKAMGYELPSGEGSNSFNDSGNISPWAIEAIEIMRNANIIQGDLSNNFNPKAPATRSEIATVLHRFIEYMGLYE